MPAENRLPIVRVDNAEGFLSPPHLSAVRARALDALNALTARSCEGSDFLGWLDLPERMLAEELPAIETQAERLRSSSDALVVIGIGGSSLGGRAALSALGHSATETVQPSDTHPVVFAGHHLNSDTLRETLDSLDDHDYAVNVISKSGTTTEPGIAFRFFLDDLKRRHPDGGWKSRLIATTDPRKGALKELANDEGFETLVVPPDVGGRFSVLSAVGLFPLAYAGVDVRAMLDGARDMAAVALREDLETNPSISLSSVRNALFDAGYGVDCLSFTNPRLRHFAGWWQQLFGESEGKDGKGPFPATCEIPADLHSLGQYIQDGRRQLYETFLHAGEGNTSLLVPAGPSRDGLDYLEGRPVSDVLEAALDGTRSAHQSGGVPTLDVRVPVLDAFGIGATFFLFQITVALGGALLGVNPFDQPGVEAYKRNMFKRLGRPGY